MYVKLAFQHAHKPWFKIIINLISLCLTSYRHLRNVHKATIFPCRLCPRKFSKKEELEQHLELFHPKDYFPCVKCPSNFGSHDELDAHVRFTHPPQLYKCAICGRTFLTKQGMCDHDDSHKKQNSAP